MDSSRPASEAPVKVMVVGDSMSHGREGDFTWRFRLWQWLRKEDVNFTFVGQFKGTFVPERPRLHPPPDFNPPVNHSGGYAQGVDFHSNHFSLWGEQTYQCRKLIGQQVKEYQPDYLLVMLGFNDMAWGVGGSEDAICWMGELVENARREKPDVRIALANVPQPTPKQGTDHLKEMVDRYNDLLEDSLLGWRRQCQTSPIELVQVAETYICTEASYDGVHPAALGEFQITKAFSRTLVKAFGVGNDELEVPSEIPERPISIPERITTKVRPYGFDVTWDAVYGARRYDLRMRVGGESTWLLESEHDTNEALLTSDEVPIEDQTEYEFQVRTDNWVAQSGWSATASATSRLHLSPGSEHVAMEPEPDTDFVFVHLRETGPEGHWDIDFHEVII
ncbi:fibronectin type III domain-containing protein [Colletotrichum sojae]|uniref:Fibronectin type III domain-containing protein n=1 Tax=Colletotrichum sojae TaxID=2175907 RepID=A0A8H6MPR0_9PEZI|nr:fibronectin type III domain-containing protein [Colletotrichum sojae]